MIIDFSSHAKRRTKQRGIEDWEIEHAVKYPSYTKRKIDGKVEAFCEIRNRSVKIVYVKEESYIKIITVI